MKTACTVHVCPFKMVFTFQQLKFGLPPSFSVIMLQMSTLCCACFHHESFGGISVRISFFFQSMKNPFNNYFWIQEMDRRLETRAAARIIFSRTSRRRGLKTSQGSGSSSCFLCSIREDFTLVCNPRSTSAFGLSTGCFQGSELNLVYKMIHCYTADCRFNHHSPSALSLSLSSLLQLNVTFSHIF